MKTQNNERAKKNSNKKLQRLKVPKEKSRGSNNSMIARQHIPDSVGLDGNFRTI
jgi:hypothetical protein